VSDIFFQSSQFKSNIQLADKTETKQFLRFYLHPSTKVMLPIQQITEVLKIQFSQIVPIPQMPAWVMGVYNWRGDILWMVDLGHLFGLNPWYQKNTNRSHHTAIVLASNQEKTQTNTETKINLGLVISKVEDLEMCNLAEIQVIPTTSGITSQLATFLQGYWLHPEGETIMVLNGEAIVAAMPNNLAN
jgi:positive phototaxis protein PixI